MSRILVVDDRHVDRYLLATLLSSRGHEVVEAANGDEALRTARRIRPALVISDVMMPVMDGFELCRRMREDDVLQDVPFMFYSATYTRPDERGFALSLGGSAYVQKPAEPARLVQAAESLLAGELPQADGVPAREFWERHRSIVLRKLEEKINELERANTELVRRDDSLRKAMTAMVETISRLIEYRDPYTAGHQRRVGVMAAAIGRAMGFDEHRSEGLLYGGYVHDVGKVIAPAEILARPGPLGDMELAIVRGHAQAGYDILQGIEFPWPVAQMALQHHEHIDGSGYPHGLRGEEILLESRIIAVADVVEAMASHRPYRPALGLAAALEEIESGAGTHFDPAVAARCLRMFRDEAFQLPQ